MHVCMHTSNCLCDIGKGNCSVWFQAVICAIVNVLTCEEQSAGLHQPAGIGQRPRPMCQLFRDLSFISILPTATHIAFDVLLRMYLSSTQIFVALLTIHVALLWMPLFRFMVNSSPALYQLLLFSNFAQCRCRW